MESVLWYLGRVLLGGYFLFSGFHHFSNLGTMAGYAQSKGIPSAKAAVALTGVLLAIGGISVLLNLYTSIGLTALVLFLIPATFMMHQFWKIQDPMVKMGEMVNFTKNLALLGGTLMTMAVPWPWPYALG